MQYSDFLELNLLENNDYAKHWDVPINDNFRAIDGEFDEIATELLVDPSLPYDGKLRGSRLSLEDRLNNAMDAAGGILYNSYDLDKSKYSRKPWTVPDNISDRIAKLEEDSYVNDRLKYSLAASGGISQYARYTNDRTPGAGSRQTKRFETNGVDLHSIHYRTCAASDFSVDVALRTIDVPALGFMQISGILYNHTIPFQTTYAAGSVFYYLSASCAATGGPGEVDCQNIRNSTVTGNTGVCSYGNDKFISVGIGAASSGVNNDWQPSIGQILRVFDSVNYHDYQIKTVEADAIYVHGKFEFGDAVTPYTWEIFDFTQPVFTLIGLNPTNETIYNISLLTSTLKTNVPLAYITLDLPGYRVSFPSIIQAGYSQYKLLTPTFDSSGFLGGMGAGSTSFDQVELEDLSAASIKSIHVIALEKYLFGGLASNPRYFISIDPVREISVSGLTYYAQSFQTYIAQISTGTHMDLVSSPGSVGMTTNIVIEHPDYADAGPASHWTSLGALTNKTLEYLGVLVELL